MTAFDMQVGGNTRAALKAYIDRIENLEDDKQLVTDDIKESFIDAKNDGFDIKIMKTVLKRRKLEREDRDNFDDLVKTYEDNLDLSLESLS